MATFGKRTHLPNVTTTDGSTGPRWLPWLLAAVLMCCAGAGALHLQQTLTQQGGVTVAMSDGQGAGTKEEQARAILLLLGGPEDVARKQMAGAIESCLPEAGRPYWTGQAKVFVTDFFIRSLSLQFDDDPGVEQRDKAFKAWVVSAIGGITGDHQVQLKRLMDNVKSDKSMPPCLLATIYRASRV